MYIVIDFVFVIEEKEEVENFIFIKRYLILKLMEVYISKY